MSKSIQETISILMEYNAWIKGSYTSQIEPRLIGDAIAQACDFLEEYEELQKEKEDLKLQLEKLRDAYVDLCDFYFENMKGN